MNPTSTLIGPTTDPTVTPIINLPPPSGPLDPNAPPFDANYWASQPPAVQVLQNMDIGEVRKFAAASLATQGYLIDFIIMGEGWGPYATMAQRVQDGYTWVLSALQPTSLLPVAPGLHVPGLPDYNPNPPFPPDTIPVANNKDFYLPYVVPPIVEPVAAEPKKGK
jgi:hypothetical protein